LGILANPAGNSNFDRKIENPNGRGVYRGFTGDLQGVYGRGVYVVWYGYFLESPIFMMVSFYY